MNSQPGEFDKDGKMTSDELYLKRRMTNEDSAGSPLGSGIGPIEARRFKIGSIRFNSNGVHSYMMAANT